MVLICVHPLPPTSLTLPSHLEGPCGRGSVTRTRGGDGWRRLLVAAVVIQHGKQFTKLQLSDILYQTKSTSGIEREGETE